MIKNIQPNKNNFMSIEERAKQIQEECHRTVDYVMSQSPKVTVQDATNVFIFHMLAKLESQIEYLRNSTKAEQ